MIKSIKYSILLAVVGSFVMAGCSDLFDKGDTERAYDGPDQVSFKTVENEIAEGESQTLEVQFLSSEGVAPSDVSVSLSVAGSASADHYTVSSTSVTIPSGETTTTVTVETSDDPDVDDGDEVTVELTIDSAEGAQVAPNLDTSTIFVQGV